MRKLRIRHIGRESDSRNPGREESANQDETFEIGIARGSSSTECRIELNGRQLDLDAHLGDEGEGWLRVHGRTCRFFAVRDQRRIQVWLDGRVHAFEVQQTGARRAGQDGAAGAIRDEIIAPMPGTILRVNVAAGQHFEAHAPLVVMESMKMEMTLTAPHEGRVKDVLCKVGQLVEMGAVLVRLHA